MTAAGLYGGNSESSALTDSGDEPMDVDTASAKPSRRNSVMTGTPTEITGEDEEDPDQVESPGKFFYHYIPLSKHELTQLFCKASTRGKRGRRRGTPATRKTTTAIPGRRGRRRYAPKFLDKLSKLI